MAFFSVRHRLRQSSDVYRVSEADVSYPRMECHLFADVCITTQSLVNPRGIVYGVKGDGLMITQLPVAKGRGDLDDAEDEREVPWRNGAYHPIWNVGTNDFYLVVLVLELIF
ncbi:hypothetical protein SCAR479_11019 [Seiridium cardinale]|uniref:Uncharacterized protein n=1 Tax=Seiridium cardinale TaxID=138064 RepID=A0ABR2XEV7_9PEZI